MIEKITLDRINLLHPKVKDEVKKIVEECNSKLTQHSQVRIVQGYRTFEEQDALYAQGRTKPGPKVTNSKGGSSFHNFGLCFDFCLLIDNKEISWDLNKDYDKDGIKDWKEVVDTFKKYGWEWGGDWHSIVDNPHLQKSFGYTWQQLLKKYNKKDFIPGTTYVNI
jgi:peptidoglycan LD-endopeptidase CwlK